jgi:hypothetical protein
MKILKIINILIFALFLKYNNCWNITIDVWKDGLYILNWNINNLTQEITFNMDVGTAGWIGLGFSKDGLMTGSDIIIGYIDSNGKPIVTDRHAIGRYLPPLDTDLGGSSDLTNIQGSYKNKRSNITFTRKLSCKDKFDYNITLGQKIFLLFSLRDTGNPSTENGRYGIHTKRTSIPTNF